ncbi:unnamed protein product [Camellia sinensis]
MQGPQSSSRTKVESCKFSLFQLLSSTAVHSTSMHHVNPLKRHQNLVRRIVLNAPSIEGMEGEGEINQMIKLLVEEKVPLC